jgi:phosphotransferase system  glucose/maltose/N-acetylglucosamine-specific IIC component
MYYVIAHRWGISDKLVYIIGPVVAVITLYIRYRWRKQDQLQKEKEKKDDDSQFGQHVSGIE